MSLNNILEYYLNKLIIIKKLMSQNNEQIKIAQELQDYLDEHKQKISDEIYKNISGMNLRQFVVNNNNFYKVTYITHNVRKYDQKYVRIEPEKKCTYVKIPEEVYVKLQEHLDKGHTCIDCNLQFDIIKKQINLSDNYVTFEGTEKCHDDDCEFYAEYFREVKIYNPIIILRIEKD
jgi:regulator of sigma D